MSPAAREFLDLCAQLKAVLDLEKRAFQAAGVPGRDAIEKKESLLAALESRLNGFETVFTGQELGQIAETLMGLRLEAGLSAKVLKMRVDLAALAGKGKADAKLEPATYSLQGGLKKGPGGSSVDKIY